MSTLTISLSIDVCIVGVECSCTKLLAAFVLIKLITLSVRTLDLFAFSRAYTQKMTASVLSEDAGDQVSIPSQIFFAKLTTVG